VNGADAAVRVLFYVMGALIFGHWILCMLRGFSGERFTWRALIPEPWPALAYFMPIVVVLSFLNGTDDRSDDAVLGVAIGCAALGFISGHLIRMVGMQLHIRRCARFRVVLIQDLKTLHGMIHNATSVADLHDEFGAYLKAARLRQDDLDRADAEDERTLNNVL